MKLTEDRITLKTIKTKNDLNYIFQWLNDKSILKYFGGKDKKRTLNQVKEEYSKNKFDSPIMILFEKLPVGFIDVYKFKPEQMEGHGLSRGEINVFGINIIIGNTNYHNKGIGTKAVKMVLGYLFEYIQTDKVVLDTYTWHKQAIRCYEKCGFKITRILKGHENYMGKKVDNIFMEISINDYKKVTKKVDFVRKGTS